jgi:hypothetical protein
VFTTSTCVDHKESRTRITPILREVASFTDGNHETSLQVRQSSFIQFITIAKPTPRRLQVIYLSDQYHGHDAKLAARAGWARCHRYSTCCWRCASAATHRIASVLSLEVGGTGVRYTTLLCVYSRSFSVEVWGVCGSWAHRVIAKVGMSPVVNVLLWLLA